MLLLTAKAGDTRKIANLGGEIEICIIAIEHGRVLFGVRNRLSQRQIESLKQLEDYAEAELRREMAMDSIAGMTDCIFLKKQAD